MDYENEKNAKIFLLAIIVLLFVSVGNWFYYYDSPTTEQPVYRVFKGTIVIYQQGNDELTFVLDTEAYRKNFRFTVTDETLISDKIRKDFDERKTGILVSVEAEYSDHDVKYEDMSYGPYLTRSIAPLE